MPVSTETLLSIACYGSSAVPAMLKMLVCSNKSVYTLINILTCSFSRRVAAR